MIKEELLHPFSAHYPITFLSLLPFLFVIYLYKKNKKMEPFIHLFFIIGLSSIAITIFLGDISLDIVKKNLCRIQDAYAHEEYGHYTLFFYLFSYSFFFIKQVTKKEWQKKTILVLSFSLSLLGSYYLYKTGHSGSMLVYEQGAAVKNFKCF